jgi:5,10-methylenetetrahydromethanopterin reductase
MMADRGRDSAARGRGETRRSTIPAVTGGRRLGVLVRPPYEPERLPDFARAAERDGYDELWLAEDCFLAGGLTMSAAALAVTETLRVGIGLLPAAVRNAAITAMELAALARLHPQRFSAAFGHGVDAWMRQIDARPPNRLVALEETVAAVRELLAGRELTVEGRFVRLREVELDHPPDAPPPILIGTTGPRGMEIAGRVADGIVLPEGSAPAAVRWASEYGSVTVYAWLSLADDGPTAVAKLRPDVERWAASGGYPRLAELAGIGEDGAVDDATLRSLAVAGDPADCARAVEALWDAGADSIVLVPPLPDHVEQTARFAADVRPRLA